MRTANLALKFLLELSAFAALSYTGSALFDGAAAVVVAILLPVLAILVWGRWAAPKASHRLPTPTRIPLELGVFAVAAVGLLLSSRPVLATIFAVLAAVNAALLTAFRQWESCRRRGNTEDTWLSIAITARRTARSPIRRCGFLSILPWPRKERFRSRRFPARLQSFRARATRTLSRSPSPVAVPTSPTFSCRSMAGPCRWSSSVRWRSMSGTAIRSSWSRCSPTSSCSRRRVGARPGAPRGRQRPP